MMLDYNTDIRSPYFEDLMGPEFTDHIQYPEVKGFEYLTGKYLVYQNKKQHEKAPIFIGKCHGSKIANKLGLVGLVLLIGLPCGGDIEVAVSCDYIKQNDIFGLSTTSGIELNDILEFEDYESARLFCELS